LTGVTLETPRLILRPPIQADFDAWAALDADERAMRFLGGPRSRAQAWLGLAAAAGMWSLRGYSLFSVLDRATGDWIGRIGPWVPEGALGTEIGWSVTPPAWGRGRAKEAATAAIDWAFTALGWSEIIHCIDADNHASIAVARGLGSSWRRAATGGFGKTVQIYGQSKHDWQHRRHAER
jgi:RimJ/RimL family protein N-acetyltransferase